MKSQFKESLAEYPTVHDNSIIEFYRNLLRQPMNNLGRNKLKCKLFGALYSTTSMPHCHRQTGG